MADDQVDHGPLGLGPTGHYPPEQVDLVDMGGGRRGGPWRLLTYTTNSSGKVSMDWWKINVHNGSTLFDRDENGVYNILRYVYDVVYLRAHGVKWPWEMTLWNIAYAARTYADYDRAMEFMEMAFSFPLPQSADEITREVWASFLNIMDDVLRDWTPPGSPDLDQTEIPGSPPPKAPEYEPGWQFSDNSDLEEREVRDDSDLEEGEVRDDARINHLFEQAIQRNDHLTVERLASRYK